MILPVPNVGFYLGGSGFTLNLDPAEASLVLEAPGASLQIGPLGGTVPDVRACRFGPESRTVKFSTEETCNV